MSKLDKYLALHDIKLSETAEFSSQDRGSIEKGVIFEVLDTAVVSEEVVIPQPQQDSALPPGWEVYTSRSTGDPFYHNIMTDKSTYERPRSEDRTRLRTDGGWISDYESSGKRLVVKVSDIPELIERYESELAEMKRPGVYIPGLSPKPTNISGGKGKSKRKSKRKS